MHRPGQAHGGKRREHPVLTPPDPQQAHHQRHQRRCGRHQLRQQLRCPMAPACGGRQRGLSRQDRHRHATEPRTFTLDQHIELVVPFSPQIGRNGQHQGASTEAGGGLGESAATAQQASVEVDGGVVADIGEEQCEVLAGRLLAWQVEAVPGDITVFAVGQPPMGQGDGARLRVVDRSSDQGQRQGALCRRCTECVQPGRQCGQQRHGQQSQRTAPDGRHGGGCSRPICIASNTASPRELTASLR